MKPVAAVTAVFGVEGSSAASALPSSGLLRFTPFCAVPLVARRPLDPVSTADALTCVPHGTPINVLCGKDPKRVFVTFPSA